uniref:DUF11 domain-containing protein n=1 Tax=Herbidospora sakaeratensis TaxID=564415 RepID=UPI0007808ABD|nr:DUF11 domain-containing protein [Herbidospora sakaeratensis]
MRTVTRAIAGVALLAAAALVAPAAASATTADDPWSLFKVTKLSYTKKAKPGGYVTYTFHVTNTGPHAADYFDVGGLLPKDVDLKKKIVYGAGDDLKCFLDGRHFLCPNDFILDVGDSTWVSIRFQLKKTAKSTQTGKVGAFVYDIPAGAENLDRARLREQNLKGWEMMRTVKTAVVKPKKK